jgi:hypothetical protein
VAFQDNINRAIVGDYPDYTLDYSQVRIAEGYSGGGSESASAAAGVLTVTWGTVQNELYEQQADDRVYIVLYHPDIDQFLPAPTPPQRADGTVEPVHLYLMVHDRHERKWSNSCYLGEF